MTYNFDEMIERIKKAKKEKGFTNKQLSDLAEVPYGTLNKILGSETKEPSINTIIKISVALGVSTEYIINGAKKNTPQPVDDEREVLRQLLLNLNDEELIEMKKFTSYLRWKREHKDWLYNLPYPLKLKYHQL